MESDKPFVKSPAFQLYPSDFLSDKNTLAMSTLEIGAYCLLLFVCWAENGLPDGAEDLADIARLPLKQFQPMWERRIERCFTKREDGKWIHKRLEKERQKQAENRAKRQSAGAKGAEARWQTDSKAIAMPSDGNGKRMANDGLSDFSLQIATKDKDPANAAKPILEQFKDLVEFKGGNRDTVGSYLGGLLKRYERDDVESAAAKTVLNNAEDPKAYMASLLNGAARKFMSQAEMNSASNHKLVI